MPPGSIRPDQRQICGTLNPPSNRSNLRPTNGQIFRKSLAAVVAREHDERVVVARSLPNCVKHAADAGIQGLVAAFGQFSALDLALPRGGLDRGSRPRPMWRRIMEAQEIRFGPRRR